MKNATQACAILLAIGLTILAGVLHGRATHRWGVPEDLQASGAKLPGLPEQFGAWRMVDSSPLLDTAVAMLECTGYVNRVYVNDTTGQRVNVALLAGPSGPISLHDPEICYQSTGFQPSDSRQREKLSESDGEEHEFWKVVFKKDDVFGEVLHVYYGWNAGQGETWKAVDHPRFTFATKSFLYKIQVAAYVTEGPDDTLDPCRAFLQDLVPVADEFLAEQSD